MEAGLFWPFGHLRFKEVMYVEARGEADASLFFKPLLILLKGTKSIWFLFTIGHSWIE